MTHYNAMQSSVRATFADTYRPLTAAQLDHILVGLQSGDLDLAIETAGHDGAAGMADLLAYREALREQADPRRLCSRLEAEADSLDLRCLRHDEQAAEFFGKAAYRRSRGDAAVAEDFTARARAFEDAAIHLRQDAMTARLRAARLRGRLSAAAALTAVVC